MKNLNFTAVIPTKNRPVDLIKAVESVLVQTQMPYEFMIVDQSPTDESKVKVEALVANNPNLNLVYIHDPKISGLVEAKRVATERFTGDIICFLEDDIILEPNYLEEMARGFEQKPEMVGCSGIVTNLPPQAFAYDFIYHFFHRGIFRDKRLEVYAQYKKPGRNLPLIPSDKISGGLSAWKREVFSKVWFDESNGFFMLEDIDFSTRVHRQFGNKLYINPNVRLEHHFSPANREVIALRQQRKMVECLTFYKKRKDWSGATLSLLWLLSGLLMEAGFKSAKTKSFKPVTGYFKGLVQGLNKK